MFRNRKLKISALLATVTILLMSTAFAWFTSQDRVTNLMKMDSLDVVLSTAFKNVAVTPGQEVEKRVSVTNRGNKDALVRVSLEEAFEQLAFDDTTNKPLVSYSMTKGVAPAGVNRPFEMELDPVTVGAIAADTTNWRLAIGGPANLTIYERVNAGSELTTDSYFAFVTSTKQLVRVTPLGVAGLADDKFEFAYQSYANASIATNTLYGGTPFNTSNVLDSSGNKLSTNVQIIFDESKITTDRTSLVGKLWFYNITDHYFYYLKPLAPGATVSLFDSLKFSSTMDNKYQGATYSLTPKMEAVQFDTAEGESQPAAQAIWQSTLGINYPNILTEWDKN
ncbi:MAG: hypothetical protein K0R71_136 [Bacillales bacterium]|jgi:hypothetical protein|nr:hypothetical protein [Bacillales bacterium]